MNAAMLLRIFVFALFFSPAVNADWYSASDNIMGTRISVELWHQDAQQANHAMGAVMDVMRAVDESMSPSLSRSELFKINQQAAQQDVIISQSLFALIEKSLHYSSMSNGAFDISFSSVGRFYDYREKIAPGQQQLDENLAAINYRYIQLDKKNHTIRFMHPQLKIDLGGIAKGYAVDRAIEQLQQLGIESAIVSAGGDSRILGDRRGNPWVIGVRHPRKDEQYAVRIPLDNTAISTSGDYERFFLKGDQRIHHIINPTTGKSASSVQSVSILAPLAVDSDALSTTVFVLGIKKGLALVNQLQGIDAIIIDAQGRLHYSDDLLRAAK